MNENKIWNAVFLTAIGAGRIWTPQAAQTPTACKFSARLPDGRHVEIAINPMGHPCEASIDWRVQRSSTHTGGGGFCLAYWLPNRGWKLRPGLWRNTSRAIARTASQDGNR